MIAYYSVDKQSNRADKGSVFSSVSRLPTQRSMKRSVPQIIR